MVAITTAQHNKSSAASIDLLASSSAKELRSSSTKEPRSSNLFIRFSMKCSNEWH